MYEFICAHLFLLVRMYVLYVTCVSYKKVLPVGQICRVKNYGRR